jgi:hypothetical protein
MSEPTIAFVRPRMAQVTSDQYGRFYEWKGERFFSVTTILKGGLPKPVLVNWAKKFVADYALDNWSLLGKKIALMESIEDEDERSNEREMIRKWLSDSPYRDRDKKADLGTLVHDYAEAHALGKPMPPIPEDAAPFLAQFRRFLDRYEPTFIAVEAPCLSRDQKYAGTLDAIVDIPVDKFDSRFLATVLGSLDPILVEEKIQALHDKGTARLLLDWKTAKSGVWPEVALQLAAYRYADTFLGMPDGSEAPVPEVDGCIAVNLRPDYFKVYPVMTDETIYRTFLYCREVFRFGRDYQKVVLGKPVEDHDVALERSPT